MRHCSVVHLCCTIITNLSTINPRPTGILELAAIDFFFYQCVGFMGKKAFGEVKFSLLVLTRQYDVSIQSNTKASI